MAFACQRNSYLKELVSKVVTCTQVKNGYEVILNDTVFFPEGGGQPDDHGKIGDVNVSRVIRRGPKAIHVTDGPLKEGDELKCSIDWKRRIDHMQQHSGQHLLSAVLDAKFGFKTTSWDLGKSISHVELNTPKISSEQMSEVEDECNERIRNAKNVQVHYLTKEQAMDLEEVKTRGLPDDVIEPIRVIEIHGVEKNMCCGTHVENLSELQMIKLLHTESMRGGVRVFFLAGDRVLNKVAIGYDVEKKLTKLLSCGIDEHSDSVEKLKGNLRVSQKSNKNYLKELGKFEAKEHSLKAKETSYIFHLREDADMDYIFSFLNGLPEESKDWIVFVSAGTVKNGGQFVLRGPEQKIANISSEIVKTIEGKGGGKKGQFQGKANSFKNIDEVEKIIQGAVNES